MSKSPWLPVSASEWIDSASIEDDPVSRYARNFVSAIPRFANRAAKIARLLPLVLMSRCALSRR
jgi:hypothetical protein